MNLNIFWFRAYISNSKQLENFTNPESFQENFNSIIFFLRKNIEVTYKVFENFRTLKANNMRIYIQYPDNYNNSMQFITPEDYIKLITSLSHLKQLQIGRYKRSNFKITFKNTTIKVQNVEKSSLNKNNIKNYWFYKWKSVTFDLRIGNSSTNCLSISNVRLNERSSEPFIHIHFFNSILLQEFKPILDRNESKKLNQRFPQEWLNTEPVWEFIIPLSDLSKAKIEWEEAIVLESIKQSREMINQLKLTKSITWNLRYTQNTAISEAISCLSPQTKYLIKNWTQWINKSEGLEIDYLAFLSTYISTIRICRIDNCKVDDKSFELLKSIISHPNVKNYLTDFEITVDTLPKICTIITLLSNCFNISTVALHYKVKSEDSEEYKEALRQFNLKIGPIQEFTVTLFEY